MTIRQIFSFLSLLLLPTVVFSQIKIPEAVNLVYTKVQLDNGLTVIVHEDHKAPIVAVNVWYHVGSKNEPKGRNGFAHLFEHLMFQGSENYNDDYFKALEKVGATNLNGTTNEDRTNYYQNVPSTALDTALFMESDRMGHFVNTISQFRLDEQRKVVLNEKGIRDNTPYWGIAEEKIVKGAFPSDHPYSWTTIGSKEDLNAATLTDVKEWFKTYYGPNNATLTIVGDVKTQDALEKVKKYFGHIPPGPRVSHMKEWIAKRNDSKTEVAEDFVPFAKIMKVFNVPGITSKEFDAIDVVSDVLTIGKNGRLYKDLIYDQQLAADVSAYIMPGEIASLFLIDASAKTGVSLEKLDQAINKTLHKFFKEGPTKDEITRVNTQFVSNFVQSLETIGGGGGKANLLASNQVFTGNPGTYKKRMEERMKLTPSEVRLSAQKWLSSGDYNLHIVPAPKFTPLSSGYDRKKIPMPKEFPHAKFPKVQEAKLSNGIRVLLAQRTEVPMVEFSMFFNAGFAKDPKDKLGLNRLTYSMLDEGTKHTSLFEMENKLAHLGSSMSAFAGTNHSGLYAKTLKQNFAATMDLFAEEILVPAFSEKEFARIQKQAVEDLQNEKARPESLAGRVFPGLLFGQNHPFGVSVLGTGNEKTLANIKREDVVKFYETWAKPNNATVIAMGDITMDELTQQLESRFGNWKKSDLPAFTVPEVTQELNRGTVFILDRPASPQTVIVAGHFYPSYNNPQEAANFVMNSVLGGSFTSRINMNLREEKGWTYGSSTAPTDLEGRRYWRFASSVQTDKTDAAINEVIKELQGIASTKPISQSEFDIQKTNSVLELSGSWETNASLFKPLKRLVAYGMDVNYFQSYPDQLEKVTLEQTRAAVKNIQPKNLTWLLIGDRSKILPGVQKLGFSKIVFIDEDGNVIK
jgi:zinc protease